MSATTRLLRHAFKLGCLAAAASSQAAFVTATGTCIDTSFASCDLSSLATVSASFDMTGSGVATPTANGASLAPFFVASSKVGAFGGVNSADVRTTAVEFGPVSTYTGILQLVFSQDVSAFAFGDFQFDSAGETIRLYDSADNLLASFGATNAGIVDLWSVTAGAGERIARVELDGSFFSLNGLAVTFADRQPVPEPASLLLAGGALLALAATRRRKAR